jgi:hypothetical protein
MPMTLRAGPLALSRAAVVVTIGSALFGAAIAPDGTSEQGAAFVVAGLSSLTGIAAGLGAAVVAGPRKRTAGVRLCAVNIAFGLLAAAIAFTVAIHNM